MALAKSQCLNAGINVAVLENKTLTIPRQLTQPDFEWKAENIAFGGGLDALTFDAVILSAKSLFGFCSFSLELFEDGFGINQAISGAVAASLANELDRAILNGAGGALEPEGIAQAGTVLTEVLPVPLIDWGCFSRAYGKVTAQNYIPTAVIGASSIWASLDEQVAGLSGQPLEMPPSMRSIKLLSSNQVASTAILGAYENCILGIRNLINIEVSRVASPAFLNGQVIIRAYLRADVGVKNPKAFCVIA